MSSAFSFLPYLNAFVWVKLRYILCIFILCLFTGNDTANEDFKRFPGPTAY